MVLALGLSGSHHGAGLGPLGNSGAIVCVYVCVCWCSCLCLLFVQPVFRPCSVNRAGGRRRRRLVSVVVAVVVVVVLGFARCGVPWFPRVRSGVAFLVSSVVLSS